MDKTYILGTKIKHCRILKGLTQAKLAELAGVHEKHISKIEIGSYKPNFDTLVKILQALDINIYNVFDNQYCQKKK